MKKSDNSGRRESMPPGGEEEKKMKNSRKMKKWGCVMLALMSGFILPGIVQASSGLSDTPQTIDGEIDGEIYYVGIKGASGNEVIIDRDLNAGVVGGYAYSDKGDATANRNSVTVNGGTVGNETEGVNIFGGYAYSDKGDATANKNSVTISGVTVNTEDNKMIKISGGYAYSDKGDATANRNSVTISGGRITVGRIFGGCVKKGKAADNIVNITDGTVSSVKIPAVSGSVPSGFISGGHASGEDSFVTGNRVNISGETILENFSEMGFIAGGDATGTDSTVTGNSVTVSSGTVVNSYISGGYTIGTGSKVTGNSVTVSSGTVVNSYISGGYTIGTGSTVTGNSVTISGGTVTEKVYGGYVRNMESSVTDNSVTISGGTVTGKVYGGYVDVWTDSTVTGSTVTGNSVTISGGTVTGEVYGGYVGNMESSVTGNSITLSGTADVSGADLYGSNLSASGTNNNLVINGWSGAVNSLRNFDQIQVKALSGGLNLTAGKRTVFVNNADGISNSSLDPTEAKEMQAGVALTVNGNVGISEDTKNIYIDVTAVRASDQTAIATESRAASVAVVGRGSEAVTDSLDALRGSGEGLDTFAAVVGSRSRYDTGSHVDVNGWNGIAGTAWTRELSSGTLRYGAFYENGGGSYDTFNTINGSSYRGSGDTVYNGGGLLLRWETRSGTYTEASLRAGMVKNEVGQALEFAGNRYGFKTENNYYGGHVGIGRIMERDDGDAWDIYGKYFHMHHEGDTVTIAGDEFAFNAVDSNRLRVGARYLDRKNDRFTGYYGVAWDYEFSGDTGGTANHHAMYTPSLKGSTLIAEIGFRGTPGGDSPWSFGVDLRGYAGEQEGLSGTVTAAYSF